MNAFTKGVIDGFPIGLGYLSVSFTFGIMAVSFGLRWWQAVLISMTTVTSAGQFDAIYGYYNGTKKPSQHTIDCAKKALEGEDNTNGAVYYYAPRYCGASSAAWFESLTFCTEIEGQRFFKS